MDYFVYYHSKFLSLLSDCVTNISFLSMCKTMQTDNFKKKIHDVDLDLPTFIKDRDLFFHSLFLISQYLKYDTALITGFNLYIVNLCNDLIYLTKISSSLKDMYNSFINSSYISSKKMSEKDFENLLLGLGINFSELVFSYNNLKSVYSGYAIAQDKNLNLCLNAIEEKSYAFSNVLNEVQILENILLSEKIKDSFEVDNRVFLENKFDFNSETNAEINIEIKEENIDESNSEKDSLDISLIDFSLPKNDLEEILDTLTGKQLKKLSIICKGLIEQRKKSIAHYNELIKQEEDLILKYSSCLDIMQNWFK